MEENKIKITYYKYVNSADVAFENAINHIRKIYNQADDKSLEELKEQYFEQFKKEYLKPMALVEYDNKIIEYDCFELYYEVYYNVNGYNLCFTSFADVDFECSERYLDEVSSSLREYAFNERDIYFISVKIEEREIDYVSDIYYNIEDVEKF